ncbi:MAG: hypothetical protein NTZ27_08465 [Ignavibacteriales bacterium]|nr:hypothetical protein [Ignavibacteriales bacterium]
MLIKSRELNLIIIKVAKSHFGNSIFNRRSLMDAAERAIRAKGFWEIEDDFVSESAGVKSKGLAKIDWGISKLKEQGKLLNISRDEWKVA